MYGYCKATSSASSKTKEPIRMLAFLWALCFLRTYGDSRQARRSAADSSLSTADQRATQSNSIFYSPHLSTTTSLHLDNKSEPHHSHPEEQQNPHHNPQRVYPSYHQLPDT